MGSLTTKKARLGELEGGLLVYDAGRSELTSIVKVDDPIDSERSLHTDGADDLHPSPIEGVY